MYLLTKTVLGISGIVFLTGCNVDRLPGSRSLNDTPHGYQIVNAPVRAGQESQRFEVRPGDCGKSKTWNDCETDRERSEIALSQR